MSFNATKMKKQLLRTKKKEDELLKYVNDELKKCETCNTRCSLYQKMPSKMVP